MTPTVVILVGLNGYHEPLASAVCCKSNFVAIVVFMGSCGLPAGPFKLTTHFLTFRRLALR